MRKLALPFMLAVALNSQASFAQESQPPPKQPSSFAGTDSPEALRKHVPVLPAVRAKYWDIDPAVGYGMKDFGNGVYALSDNGWQSAFLVTGAGVIVFDAPASYGKHIPEAVAKVTNKPITMLVYSHIHKDHIGGSAAFKNTPGLQIIALDTVSDFLKEMNDPDRLIPTETFKTSKTIKLGGKTVELTRHNYHSNEGDLFIYVPEAKFLMAVDSVTSGYVPFQDFDLSTNFHQYLKMFDEILPYKFDNFIGGHLTDTGTRKDVEITKEYTNDVYQTVKRIHNGLNERAFDAEIAKTIGPDNEFLIFKALLDKVTRDSVAELEPRWINRLAGVDVWLPSHVRAALIYVRWDDKE
ncbi:MAG TPA: MBL fold metallo-hydrolase [Candidatus Binatus sp.]|jgi:glyoxylase-like metal-dependent hydrolase (beta-lactamase superfamily II)|nr:MBL fold metallo-hydrolase [Candidatus Binatus sp.]